MNIQPHSFECERCGERHHVDLDLDTLSEEQLKGRAPVLNFVCPNIAFMYRVMSFIFDTRTTVLKDKRLEDVSRKIVDDLKLQWGNQCFDEKLERYLSLDVSLMGLPEEYGDLLWSVVAAYSCGYFYPAITSAGSLGERIFNRLILKTRNHFKSSDHYKKIYNKNSIDSWNFGVEILIDWKIISDEIGQEFLKLNKYRNDSVHYKEGYDFKVNAFEAVKSLAKIIMALFSYSNRKDLFWVYDVPGEIWLRSNQLNNPFVKEFVLPHCMSLTPFCEPTANPPIFGKKAHNLPRNPLKDNDFIRIRNEKREPRVLKGAIIQSVE